MASLQTPTMTLAIAVFAGVLCQTIARHLNFPGIILLLIAGVLLGPDGIELIVPANLGNGLYALVGFSVAVILFEGGLNLKLGRLRREALAIRRLITLGALITALGGGLAAHLFMGWGIGLSALFGTLVIVTGPTVVTPLLRRLNVDRKVSTVLEAEGVLIDAVGAIAATIALEAVLSPSGADVSHSVLHMVYRLGFGAAIGLVGGFVLALLFRHRAVIPDGLENILTLSYVLALFHLANAFQGESGIAAVTVAGLVFGNVRSYIRKDLVEFKEQLTVLLIGVLFVLLAADVRLSTIHALGYQGALTVAALILIVRPVSVLLSCWGSDLQTNQRVFMAFIAPRGIVAAAVTSFFAVELRRVGIAGGEALQALVFLLIGVTVLLAGLLGGPLASLLGVRRRSDVGWVIIGANPVAIRMGHSLSMSGEEVLLIDKDPEACRKAEKEGLRVFLGDALDERVLTRSELDTRAGVLALTSNDEVNLLFARKAKEQRAPRIYVSLSPGDRKSSFDMLDRIGGLLLFGCRHDIGRWTQRLSKGQAELHQWRLNVRRRNVRDLERMPPAVVMALSFRRRSVMRPVTDDTVFRKGDLLTTLIDKKEFENIAGGLRMLGFVHLDHIPIRQMSDATLVPSQVSS